MSQPLVNGVYNIKAHTGACLQFASNQANLTLLNCGTGPEQQWDVRAMDGETYSIQNIKYTTYITTSTPSLAGNSIGQNSTPYGWYIRLNGTNVYVICPDNSYSLALNPLNFAPVPNDPVKLYMCCYDDKGWTTWDLFQFISKNSTSSSTSPSTSPSTSLSTSLSTSPSTSSIIAIVVSLGATAIVCIGLLSWYKYIKHRRINVA